ncbi:MAG: hypothetical protein OEZ10_03560 [Gammaproteobacteria bacterium]|nr:hypothetical protein [Gammaproteobacteria bacterium]
MATFLSINELQAFIRNRRIPLFPKHEHIELKIDGLSFEENLQLETRVNKLHAACGCAEGSIASVAGLTLFVVYLTFIDIDAVFSGSEALITAGLVFLVSALTAKFGAILFAHLQLKKLSRSLNAHEPD